MSEIDLMGLHTSPYWDDLGDENLHLLGEDCIDAMRDLDVVLIKITSVHDLIFEIAKALRNYI